MKWGFKMSKEKEEQTPEAVAEEATDELWKPLMWKKQQKKWQNLLIWKK